MQAEASDDARGTPQEQAHLADEREFDSWPTDLASHTQPTAQQQEARRLATSSADAASISSIAEDELLGASDSQGHDSSQAGANRHDSPASSGPGQLGMPILRVVCMKHGFLLSSWSLLTFRSRMQSKPLKDMVLLRCLQLSSKPGKVASWLSLQFNSHQLPHSTLAIGCCHHRNGMTTGK